MKTPLLAAAIALTAVPTAAQQVLYESSGPVTLTTHTTVTLSPPTIVTTCINDVAYTFRYVADAVQFHWVGTPSINHVCHGGIPYQL